MAIYREIITSRNNDLVKWAVSLSNKKSRDESASFLAEGAKLSFEALASKLPVTYVFVAESKRALYDEKLCKALEDNMYAKTEVVPLSDSAFLKISSEKAPQGIITVIKYLDFFKYLDIIYKEDFFLAPSERAIALSSVRDPGNLGAVIRSSVGFGVEHIILSSDSADVYNTKTVRAAMGSLFKVKITYVNDLVSFIKSAKACGRRVFSAELSDNAKSLSDMSLSKSDIFVIGNEGHGIEKSVSNECNHAVYIPISNKTESLNAAVAAAVLMWEQAK